MLGVKPTVETDFAQWPGISGWPQFWEGLVCALVPRIGYTGIVQLIDRSGNGCHGDVYGGAISWSWKNRFGLGISLHGAGDGDQIKVPYRPLLNGKRTILMVWETSDGFSSANGVNRTLWEHRDNAGEFPGATCYLDQTNGKITMFDDPGAGGETLVQSIRTSWEDETYVTAFTADGTNMTMYVNGVYENSVAFATAFTDSTNVFRWGMNRQDLYGFVGRVAAMYIFTRALSAIEVLRHYEHLLRTLTSSSQGMFTKL